MIGLLGYVEQHPWTFLILLVVVNLIFFYGGRAVAMHDGDIRKHPAWSRVLEMAESYAQAGDEDVEPVAAPVARGTAKIERLALPAKATAVPEPRRRRAAPYETIVLEPIVMPDPDGRPAVRDAGDRDDVTSHPESADGAGSRIAAATLLATLAIVLVRFVSGGNSRLRR